MCVLLCSKHIAREPKRDIYYYTGHRSIIYIYSCSTGEFETQPAAAHPADEKEATQFYDLVHYTPPYKRMFCLAGFFPNQGERLWLQPLSLALLLSAPSASAFFVILFPFSKRLVPV